MTDLDHVRVPRWLVAHLPAPENGESFRTYWERVAVGSAHIDRALAGLDERTGVCAHHRIAHTLRMSMPRAFDAFVVSLGEGYRPVHRV